MQILFVISLLFAILVAVFAVQNSDPVTINLLWKQYPASQAIVILGSAAVGAVVVALLGIFSKIKSTLKIRELQNKVKNLENALQEQNETKDVLSSVNARTIDNNLIQSSSDLEKNTEEVEDNVSKEDTENKASELK